MANRRVVVTGLGTINPLGTCVEQSWTKLICAHSGIKSVFTLPKSTKSFPVALINESFENTNHELFKYPRWIQLAIYASKEAIESSLLLSSKLNYKRIGSSIGNGIGSIEEIETSLNILHCQGPRKISPRFISSILLNSASALMAREYGFKGPISSVNNACATGNSSILEGFFLIKNNDADVMIVGASESPIAPLIVSGFSQTRALASISNTALIEKLSRPFDDNRSGFVLGEGAAILVLEDLEHAKNRNAPILAELTGYGLNNDAFHMTSPDPEGKGAYSAMNNAILKKNINPEQIGYISAHATSTQIGDVIEAKSIYGLFHDNSSTNTLLVSSTKGATGHLLGAAGALESLFSILSLRDNICPPTLNLDILDPSIPSSNNISYIAKYSCIPKQNPLQNVLNNSFGFGGVNCSLLFSRVVE